MVTDLIAEREYLEIYARRYSDGAEAGYLLIGSYDSDGQVNECLHRLSFSEG